MANNLVPYFYDGQIRRFMLQIARAFSNFQCEYGKDQEGNPILVRIPCMYGNASRQAADIIAKNTQNNLPAAPQITFYISNVKYARERVQDPTYTGKIAVRQRTYDEVTNTYERTQGNAFIVERMMPVPYDITINVDFWTSNEQQKQSIFEQVGTLFNPAIEIQSTDNYIDWTSLTTLEQTDLQWSSRTIPQGQGNAIDIMTFTLKLPVWISPPVKVTKYGVIHKIITNIFDESGDANNALTGDDILAGTRAVVTPMGYQILLLEGQIQCLRSNVPHQPPNVELNDPTEDETSTLLWHNVVDLYGALRNGISQIRIQNHDLETEIIGTVAYHPSDDRILLFSVDADTLPPNTLQPINAVINPQRSGPGSGLPLASPGQRYLLTDNIGNKKNTDPAPAWTENGVALIADADDIIEYDGQRWFISFDASEVQPNQQIEFVTNLKTKVQYKFDVDLGWIKSYEGFYRGGDWSIVL